MTELENSGNIIAQKNANALQINAGSIILARAQKYLIQTKSLSPKSDNSQIERQVITIKNTQGQIVAGEGNTKRIVGTSRAGGVMVDTCELTSTSDPTLKVVIEDAVIKCELSKDIVRNQTVRGRKSINEITGHNGGAVSIRFQTWELDQISDVRLKQIRQLFEVDTPVQIKSNYLIAMGIQYILVQRFPTSQIEGMPFSYDCEIQGFATDLIDILEVQ